MQSVLAHTRRCTYQYWKNAPPPHKKMRLSVLEECAPRPPTRRCTISIRRMPPPRPPTRRCAYQYWKSVPPHKKMRLSVLEECAPPQEDALISIGRVCPPTRRCAYQYWKSVPPHKKMRLSVLEECAPRPPQTRNPQVAETVRHHACCQQYIIPLEDINHFTGNIPFLSFVFL